jgi:hypothetical protein
MKPTQLLVCLMPTAVYLIITILITEYIYSSFTMTTVLFLLLELHYLSVLTMILTLTLIFYFLFKN